jgi:hypothetical protein
MGGKSIEFFRRRKIRARPQTIQNLHRFLLIRLGVVTRCDSQSGRGLLFRSRQVNEGATSARTIL